MATAAGSTKMPAPIVALMMFAVSSRVPITRTSCSSGDRLPVVRNANLRVSQIVPEHHRDEHHFHFEAIADACDLRRNLIVEMPVVEAFPHGQADVDEIRQFLVAFEMNPLLLANVEHVPS